MVLNGSPPYSNTGAQNTLKNRVVLDWCGFTVSSEIDIQFLLNIPLEYFEELPKGANGYKKQARFSGITIMWDGSEGMGTHIEMSGMGCRTFEAFFGDVWKVFFLDVVEHGGHFTRIDLALDDFEGLLHMRTLESKVRRGHVRSKWKEARVLNKLNLSEGVHLGRTIYFGSPTSRVLTRFYDKALEQLSKGVEVVPDHWVRCEMQCRDERASRVVEFIIGVDCCLGELAAMFLRNYLEFVNPVRGDRNKSRWPVSRWWDVFLFETGKLKLTIQPEKRDLDKVRDWLKRQVSTSMALLSVNSKGELVSFEEVVELAMSGVNKLKEKHLDLVKDEEKKRTLYAS